jgi:hypothetical protein
LLELGLQGRCLLIDRRASRQQAADDLQDEVIVAALI